MEINSRKRPLPVGLSDFKKVCEGNYAYVDKTLLIAELIEKGKRGRADTAAARNLFHLPLRKKLLNLI